MTKGAANKGFTLIEMTVVVVVVAIIVGGIVLAKSMIHAAQLRATIKQIEMFDAAVGTFRLKYACIPGDCLNASAFGFKGGFTVEISRKLEPETSVFASLNPVAPAHATGFQPWPPGVANQDPEECTGNPQECGGLGGEVIGGVGGGGGGGSGGSGGGGSGGGSGGSGGGAGGGGTPSGDGFSMGYYTFDDPNGNGDWRVCELETLKFGPILHQAKMVQDYEQISGKIVPKVSGTIMTPAVDDIPAMTRSARWHFSCFVPSDNSLIREAGHYLTPVGSVIQGMPAAATLTTSDALRIDQKRDDGRPLTGRVMSSSDKFVNLFSGPSYFRSAHLGPEGEDFCITGNEDYNLSSDNRPLCSMMVRAFALD